MDALIVVQMIKSSSIGSHDIRYLFLLQLENVYIKFLIESLIFIERVTKLQIICRTLDILIRTYNYSLNLKHSCMASLD